MSHTIDLFMPSNSLEHVNNIPTMQFFTGISRNTQSGISKIMHCGILINMPYQSMWLYVMRYFIWSHIFSSVSPAADITEDSSLLSEQTTESTEQLMMVTPRGRSDNNDDNINSYNHQVIGHVYNSPFFAILHKNCQKYSVKDLYATIDWVEASDGQMDSGSETELDSMYGILAVSSAKLQNLLPIKLG